MIALIAITTIGVWSLSATKSERLSESSELSNDRLLWFSAPANCRRERMLKVDSGRLLTGRHPRERPPPGSRAPSRQEKDGEGELQDPDRGDHEKRQEARADCGDLIEPGRQ